MMTFIALTVLLITIYVGATGDNPNEHLFGRIAVISLLAFMGILMVLCICFSKVSGKGVYKFGFYLLHCGLIVLVVGFVLTNLTCKKYTLYLESGNAAYSTFNFEDGSSFSLNRRMGVESVKTEYYEDGNPKYYEAKLVFYPFNPSSNEKVDEKILTVNHPVRVEGYKVYLMSIGSNDGGAVLLVKYNPGEYVTIFGICTLLVGTFVMCFSNFEKKEETPIKDGRQQKKKSTRGGERI